MINMENNTQKLIELIKENPDLPIIPMVYYEVVGEDYGNWVGRFSTCYIGEYALFQEKYYEDRDEFEEDYYDYFEDFINDKFGYNPALELPNKPEDITQEQLDANKIASQKVNDFLKEQSNNYLHKAIIVYVDSLD